LLANHTRLERLTALVRFGVEGWLEEMDEAWSVLRSVDEGKEAPGLARRVYHVHVVTRMREEGSGEPPRLDLYRIALTREGIVRTERLGAGEKAAPQRPIGTTATAQRESAPSTVRSSRRASS
jgi:hypothetical protein